jgi:hypothetical protein
MLVDFAGRTGEVVDANPGEIIPAQIFVAVLGASSFTYAEAVWSASRLFGDLTQARGQGRPRSVTRSSTASFIAPIGSN